MQDGFNPAAERWEQEWSSRSFKHGVDVGTSIGHYELAEQTRKLYERGLINTLEEWLEWQRPKTMKGWKKFHAKHPELKAALDEMRATHDQSR